MCEINLKAVSSINVSRRSTRWRLSSAADADGMWAVAVAHKGIVESAITWSSETSNLANLFWDAAQVVLSPVLSSNDMVANKVESRYLQEKVTSLQVESTVYKFTF